MVQALNSESMSNSAIYQQLMAALSPSGNASSSSLIDGGSKAENSGSIEDKFLNFLQKGFDKIDKNQDSQVSMDEIGSFVEDGIGKAVDEVAEFAETNLKKFVSNADSPFNGLAKMDFGNFAQNLGQTVINAYKSQGSLMNLASSAAGILL